MRTMMDSIGLYRLSTRVYQIKLLIA